MVCRTDRRTGVSNKKLGNETESRHSLQRRHVFFRFSFREYTAASSFEDERKAKGTATVQRHGVQRPCGSPAPPTTTCCDVSLGVSWVYTGGRTDWWYVSHRQSSFGWMHEVDSGGQPEAFFLLGVEVVTVVYSLVHQQTEDLPPALSHLPGVPWSRHSREGRGHRLTRNEQFTACE